MKQAYFRAIKRAFFLTKEANKLRESSLKKKVFRSYKKKKEFQSLKLVILKICVDKYENSLTKKSLFGLSTYTKESLRLNGLLNVHRLKKTKRLMQKVIIAFLSTMGENALKRREYMQID